MTSPFRPLVLVLLIGLATGACKGLGPTSSEALLAEPTRVYWGDIHLHTSYSADAYLLGNTTADPATAYRWAKGLPVVHPHTRATIRIETPLDFLVVADHAEMLTVPLKLMEGTPALANTATGRRWIEMMREERGVELFKADFGSAIKSGIPISDFSDESSRKAAWKDIIDAAAAAYEPCEFTSFIGWEWTSSPDGNNLHRVVFMRDGAHEAGEFLPFTSFDSQRPEALWDWLAETSQRVKTDFVAIPHKPVASGGLMFDDVDSEGRPITAAYARTRMRWEPVVEITQMTGDFETVPSLSPDDEFAGFETSARIREVAERAAPGDYVRSALLRGIEIGARVGANPYQVGFIGSTDAHTGIASAEENNFWGLWAIDSAPQSRFVELAGGMRGSDVSAQGLAAVWAEENTRQALFAAFKRKEVYATTGPRIRVRFFGGWDYGKRDAKDKDLVNVGYIKGRPMGSDLTQAPKGKAPTFLMYAVKDPKGANLDRMQIIKGWLDEAGHPQERVYDVAWSDGREPNQAGRVPPVGNTVDTVTGKYTNDIGAASLATFWKDPDFDSKRRAFYYLRVLEIPTPRHSLYGAIALRMNPAQASHPATIQERAYSSPIWYTP